MIRIRPTLAPLAVLALALPAAAQHARVATPAVRSAPAEAKQFDFLVGQWEIVARPYASGLAARIHGRPKLPGTWKAWHGLDGWGIEDEVRLTDGSGNPIALTHTLRVWDAAARRWSISALDVYRSKFQPAAAEWRDGEMHATAKGTDAEGRAFVSRTRFHEIGPASFRMRQDRSYDDGRTWTEGFLEIEATRAAAVAPR
jgi:hypothetical protein